MARSRCAEGLQGLECLRGHQYTGSETWVGPWQYQSSVQGYTGWGGWVLPGIAHPSTHPAGTTDVPSTGTAHTAPTGTLASAKEILGVDNALQGTSSEADRI